MATDKDKHLDCVLKSYKMSNVQELLNKYLKKRDAIKVALDAKYSEKKATSAINSGSYAKHTAINIKFDLDICIPFLNNSFTTLEEMADDVYDYFNNEYEDIELIYTKPQRVSTGLVFNIDGDKVDMDIVSGREINEGEYNITHDLKLYVRSKNGEPASSTKTNIKKHVDFISGKTYERDVIRLLKIWKRRNNRDYKSFLIELLVIKAFNTMVEIPNGLWNRLKYVIEYIRDNIEVIQVKDPANSNNIVSDTMDIYKKQSLSNDMKNMLESIEENSDYIKSYFPINEEFPCEEETDERMESSAGATILSTKSFGLNE